MISRCAAESRATAIRTVTTSMMRWSPLQPHSASSAWSSAAGSSADLAARLAAGVDEGVPEDLEEPGAARRLVHRPALGGERAHRAFLHQVAGFVAILGQREGETVKAVEVRLDPVAQGPSPCPVARLRRSDAASSGRVAVSSRGGGGGTAVVFGATSRGSRSSGRTVGDVLGDWRAAPSDGENYVYAIALL